MQKKKSIFFFLQSNEVISGETFILSKICKNNLILSLNLVKFIINTKKKCNLQFLFTND